MNDPLDLYDFIYKGLSTASKEELLELLKGAPDLDQLKHRSAEDLRSIYYAREHHGERYGEI